MHHCLHFNLYHATYLCIMIHQVQYVDTVPLQLYYLPLLAYLVTACSFYIAHLIAVFVVFSLYKKLA